MERLYLFVTENPWTPMGQIQVSIESFEGDAVALEAWQAEQSEQGSEQAVGV
jgi:hypothetical protein